MSRRQKTRNENARQRRVQGTYTSHKLCHKCRMGPGSSNDTRPLTHCSECATTYHALDCRNLYAKSGLAPELAAECPKCAKRCVCVGGPIRCGAQVSAEQRAKRQKRHHPGSEQP